MQDFRNILMTISIFQFLLLGIFLLFFRGENRSKNVFLSVFLISKALCFIDDYLFSSFQIFINHPQYFYIGQSFELLLGPSLLFYIKTFVEGKTVLKWKDLLHVLPFLVYSVLITLQYHILSNEEKINFLLDPASNGTTKAFLIYGTTYAHFIIYSMVTLIKILQYRKKLFNVVSNLDNWKFPWISFLLVGFILIWLTNLFFMFIPIPMLWGDIAGIITVLGIFTFVNSILLYLMRKPKIYSPIEIIPEKKYEKTQLPLEIKNEYISRLTDFMTEQKPYLNPEINLTELSGKVSIPPHHLSQLINTHYKQNFYDFINYHRIEESKKILVNSETHRKTILEVLFESGFNSKSVFNSAFRKYVGMTPSEFKKIAQNN